MSKGVKLAAVVMCLVKLTTVTARILQSPCPNVFSYKMDTNTNVIFGQVLINNVQPGEDLKLSVSLSIATQLPTKSVGTISLLKSRQSTVSGILQGLPVLYRVNFPAVNILPTVVSISINGKVICTGYRAQGQLIQMINLEHTFYTELQFQLLGQTKTQPSHKPSQAQRPKPTVPVPHQPVRVRTTVAPPRASPNSKCSKPSSAFLNRLSINGELVDKGQFPWSVPLFDRTHTSHPRYICGSTIITKKHLLTAAHCVYEMDDFMSPDQLLAVPGMYNIDNFFDENIKLADVEAIFPHEDYFYDDDLNDADIAVLRLKDALEFSEFISPICTWQSENDLTKIVGQDGFVTGWGLTETGTASVPSLVRTTVMDRHSCSENLSRVYPSYARIFCGDGQGSVPCNGDSGSGLVLRNGNQYFLRGVVSRGLVDPSTLMCDVNKYVIYTDVALFRYWLRSITNL